MRAEVRIDEPYSGMPGIPLGGYVAGLIASELGRAASVRLLRPTRMGCELTVDVTDGVGRLLDGDDAVAEGERIAGIDIDVPAVSLDEADAAATRFSGFRTHLFPGCYCCGTNRLNGLRIFPAPLEGRPIVAAVWTPKPLTDVGVSAVPVELIWTALDCPAIWAQLEKGEKTPGLRGLTGQIEVETTQPIGFGDPLVVIGWPLGVAERRLVTAAAILSPAAEPLAISRQTLVMTDRGFSLVIGDWPRSDEGQNAPR